ncbi:MAG: hypothetical protein R2932_07015 [Caldilineaceae bacterium]
MHKPNSARLLDNIVATLRRLSHLNWWQDTIIFVCGLLIARPTELQNVRQSIVCINLLESEQIFLTRLPARDHDRPTKPTARRAQ